MCYNIIVVKTMQRAITLCNKNCNKRSTHKLCKDINVLEIVVGYSVLTSVLKVHIIYLHMQDIIIAIHNTYKWIYIHCTCYFFLSISFYW